MICLCNTYRSVWRRKLLVLVVIGLSVCANAQEENLCTFRVKDDRMWITIGQQISTQFVDSFIRKYNLADIGLHSFVASRNSDSLIRLGWAVQNQGKKFIISKPLGTVDTKSYPAGKIIFTPVPTPENWREVGGNRTTFGFNSFESDREFKRDNNVVFFTLRGHTDAKRVRLAGNFTNWQHAAFPMTRTNDGWVVQVKLQPGQYYYKFIINDNHWITDPANELSENDGRGNVNSVYFVPNEKFRLKNHKDAQEVFLSGTFNNWTDDEIPLKKTENGWELEMFVEEGTYDYHYVVDGKVVEADGSAKQKLAIGKSYLFKLRGFTNARRVVVAGNFNKWRRDELQMKKVEDGWELKYILGPGNYQYKFIVDGSWRVDPANEMSLHDIQGNLNSLLIIGANYTFKLKGYTDAKEVWLTGDFTEFSPDGVRMKRTEDGWEASVYLAKGKHRYNYIVNGRPIIDPSNKQWEKDEGGKQRSVLWIDPNEIVRD